MIFASLGFLAPVKARSSLRSPSAFVRLRAISFRRGAFTEDTCAHYTNRSYTVLLSCSRVILPFITLLELSTSVRSNAIAWTFIEATRTRPRCTVLWRRSPALVARIFAKGSGSFLSWASLGYWYADRLVTTIAALSFLLLLPTTNYYYATY